MTERERESGGGGGKRGTTYTDVFHMWKENKLRQDECEEREEREGCTCCGVMMMWWGDVTRASRVTPLESFDRLRNRRRKKRLLGSLGMWSGNMIENLLLLLLLL